jgi:cellulose synthase operon protein C
MKRAGTGVFFAWILSAGLLVGLSGCDYFRSPEMRTERARKFIEDGDRRRALVELKNALQAAPQLAEARVMLAETAFWLGDPASAELELAKVKEPALASRMAELQARIDLELGRPERVISVMDQVPAVMSAPQRALYRGLALQDLGKLPEAESAFREALASEPDLVPAQTGIAEVLGARHELKRALESSRATVDKNPQSALAWYSHGMLLVRAGQPIPAEDALQRAAALAPSQLTVMRHAAVLAALIEAQVANRNLPAARTTNELLGRVAARSTLSALMTGRIAVAAEDFVTATSELRRVVNTAPEFSQARFMLGVALAAQGNLEQAGQELSTVVEQMPENLEARQMLAQVRMRQQDPDAALRVLVPAVQSDEDDSQLSALLDSIRLPAGDSRSVEVLERALAASPETRSLEVQLASAYLQAGKPKKAIELLRQGSAQNAENSVREAGLLVQALLQTEGVGAAREEMQQLLRHRPDDVAVLALAAAFHARVGEPDKARELIRSAIPKNPNKVALLFTLAQIEWAARRPDSARTALQEVLALEPANKVAQMSLAEVETALGDTARAAQLLESLRTTDKLAVEPRIALMKLALRRDDAKQARVLASEILAARPNEAPTRRNLGILYLGFGRFDSALEVLQEAAKLDPKDAGVWLTLGRAQAALEQVGAARESFLKSLELKPGWIAPSGALAFLELQSGDTEAALRRIADLKTQLPSNPAVLELEGELRSVMRQHAAASAAYEGAFALQPSASLAAKIYAVRDAGNLGAPLHYLEQWTRTHPQDLSLVSLMAEGYIKAGNRDAAIAQYERLILAHPKHVASLNNLAWLYYEKRDPRAIELARRASELAPTSAAVSDTFGWVLVENGKVAEGLAVLERAVGQAGAEPEVRFHHAAALAKAGRRADAQRALAALLRDPVAFPSRAEAEKLNSALQAPERGG